MKKFFTLLVALSCYALSYGQQHELQAAPANLIKVDRVGSLNLNTLRGGGNNCGVDTVQYPMAKTITPSSVTINVATSADKVSQYYDAPQPITVFGFDWYGWQSSGNAGVVNITCAIYLAGPDSLPTGSPLASVVIPVDSTFGLGSLPEIMKTATFPTPVTVNAPYVLSIETPSTTDVAVVFNDWTAGDGQQEWLGSASINGVGWLHGYELVVGGVIFDSDLLAEPHVSYNLTADFNATPICLSNPPTTVTFTDNSSAIMGNRMYNRAAYIGAPEVSYTYNYGDGSPNENVINPTHVFNTNGPFTTTLTDTLFGWSVTCVETATAVFGPQAQAAFSNTSNNLTANFTDMSSGSPQSWLWDFGDGNTSTQQNPIHTYAADGTYTVCLTITDICGTDSSCSSVVICTLPTAQFSNTTTALTATFTDMSNSATSWLWDFGDGNTSTQQNPTHTYAVDGTYTVCLTITDACGTDSSCSSVVVCTLPTAQFSNTTAALTATFTDMSSSATSWAWDFGDGNTSTQQNPIHTYAADGTYTVCLIVTDACGADTICNPVTINCPNPTAQFSSVETLLTATFTDMSSSATSWLWEFGDGNTSTQQNPTHTYATPGTYTVCLIVSDSCGIDTVCNPVVISCPAPAPGFTYNAVGSVTNFTNTTTAGGGIIGYLWDFGDGNTSTVQDPQHTYAADGTYTVCLTVTDTCGTDSTCQTITIIGTGIDRNALEQTLNVYPNPAKDVLQVALSYSGTKNLSIKMVDLTGKTVMHKTMTNANAQLITLNTSTLSEGIYILHVNTNNESVARKVTIIK